ncbi:MAG: alpha/beta fold hydrolase [Pseudomonadota bacterium]
MMRMPDALPMHLMLAMMQSGLLPNASMPWSNPLHAFMPDWMRPKTPLEQGVEQMQTLWQNASDQWSSLSEQLLKSPFPQPQKPSPQPKQKSDQPPNSADFLTDFFNPDFLSSLSTQAYNHSTGFLQGMQAYLASDYERPEKSYDVLWERGSARLLDLAPDMLDGVAVLCIPSLINRSTILDLYPGASFVDYLKARGFRPLILDWGTPDADEQEFTTADYISFYALDALSALRENHNGPIAVLGYCMGGIFATAVAQLAAREVDALILLATPWDFSAPDTPTVLLAAPTQAMLRQWIGSQSPVQPLVTQTVFHLIDPWRVQEKFSRYPHLSDAEKQHFLAVEQWVNDGVPLAQKVAEECFVDWPHGNILANHQWKIGRRWIEPASITCPTLAVIPTRDLIVPKGCALPLTQALTRCDVLMPETGHVSMVVGKNAKKLMWEPVAEWLEEKF